MKDIAYALSLGMSVVLSFLIGIGIGFYINEKFNLNGFGMVIGVFVGAMLAFSVLFRMMRNDNDG